MFKPELLAPAGDLERLKIAIDFGADAVFIGGQEFGLRANANNFSFEQIKEACEYAHQRNAKIYVTTNIIFHDENVLGFIDYIKQLEECGVDACICADLYAASLIKQHSNLEIHLSTQQSIINSYSAQFISDLGITRIVLAREASKDEITKIIANSKIEIEVFIHGSMCIAYSGKCMLSNHMTARDANRGGCSQNCRWEFQIHSDNRNYSNDYIDFTMNPDDLTLVDHIKELCEMNVASLKIEGRMRSIYYIATVVSTYRKLIDEYSLGNDVDLRPYKNNLLKAANRRISAQYFDKIPDVSQQNYDHREEHPSKVFCGVLLEQNDQLLKIEQRNYFKVGDFLEFFGPKTESIVIEVKKMYNSEHIEIEVARHPQEIIYIQTDLVIDDKCLIRKVVNDEKE